MATKDWNIAEVGTQLHYKHTRKASAKESFLICNPYFRGIFANLSPDFQESLWLSTGYELPTNKSWLHLCFPFIVIWAFQETKTYVEDSQTTHPNTANNLVQVVPCNIVVSSTAHYLKVFPKR